MGRSITEGVRLSLAFLPEDSRPADILASLPVGIAALIRMRKPGRPALPPNVEINAALLLDPVGIPRDAFTPLFAVGRCAGWLAHAMEQRESGRLIRPSSAYVGPVPASAASA